MTPYAEDSFHTLSPGGQIGLVALSVILSLACLALLWWAGRRLSRVQRVLLAIVLFAGFVWLSPQVYYEYYRLIIDGLPAQNVIRQPPDAQSLLRLMTFRSAATLSDHGKAVLGWALIAQAVLQRRRFSKSTDG